MGDHTATVVIDARLLMREALVSLMESHSYDVICSVGSTADIDRDILQEAQPELVILGALPIDRVADATTTIRGCWKGVKIIMLVENASSKDLQKLLAAGLDGCIPMFASPRTLLDTLQLIVCEHLRVFVVNESIALDVLIDPEQADEAMQGHSLVASLASSLQVPVPGMPCARGLLAKDAGDTVVQIGGVPGLSEREEQILKALVRGYSNKMIARMYSVTEATVKVHMKSILRKIRVVNRTQAAIWALKNAYSSEDVNEERPRTPKAIQDVPLVNGHSC